MRQMVCIKTDAWFNEQHCVYHRNGPKFNEIVEVKEIDEKGYLKLYGYEWVYYKELRCSLDPWYNPMWFVPIVSDEALAEELASINEPITV